MFAALSTTMLLLGAGIAAACSGSGGTGSKCSWETASAWTQGPGIVTTSSAVLRGAVTPRGCETSYQFKWGVMSGGYTSSAGGTISAEEAAGLTEKPVETTIAVKPNTTYYYRLFATNTNGTVQGAEWYFTTPGEGTPPPEKPSVTTEAASGIGATGATLNASVNPHGASTTYKFEYGTEKGVLNTSTSSASAGSGTISTKVNKVIANLNPSTVYYYRISATNSAGTSTGTEVSFTTFALATNWAIQTTPNPTGASSSRLTFGSCSASTACTSVGQYVNSGGSRVPLAERWNGTVWAAQTPAIATGATWSDLLGVSCPSSTWCTAVGAYEGSGGRQSLAEGWNGTSWSVQTAPSPVGATSTELSAVSCTSNTACTAVGDYTSSSGTATLALRWNGTSWSIQTTPNPSGATNSSLLGVSCTSSTACTAAGYYYNSSGVRVTLAEAWNGSTWSIETTPNRTGATGNILLGVSCTASTACTAVGGDFPSSGPQETLVERWNGVEWTIQPSFNPSGSEASVLHGISCVSATACTADGDYINAGVNVTLAERWNGTTWSQQITPNPNGASFSALWSAACWSATECIAPGYYKNASGVEQALTEKSS